MADDIEKAMAEASARQRNGEASLSGDEDEIAPFLGQSTSSTADGGDAKTSAAEPERRYVDGKWLCLLSDGTFMEYLDNEWKAYECNVEETKTKWNSATLPEQPLIKEVDGRRFRYNPFAKQYIPDDDPDEDVLLSYQANYGNEEDFKQEDNKPEKVVLTKEEKRAKKREAEAEAAERQKGWIEMDEAKNTKVYVTGLPPTITDQEFEEMLAKYGVIMPDPRTNKNKIKLYRNDDGTVKGDGICSYVKRESVELALRLLDGLQYDAEHTITVEPARFEMRGEFDPSKKKARLTTAQKKRFIERTQKIFEWTPDKPRNYRPISDCTVVLKNMFSLEEIDTNPAIILDLKEELKQTYTKFGRLKNVKIYDSHPEGVVTLTYENVEESELAVKSLNGIIKRGRQITAELWDGKTKYVKVETEEERRRREAAWENFLEVDEDNEEEEEPAPEE